MVVDVGTGSGCIALSLAAERPDAWSTPSTLRGGARGRARRTRARLGLAERVRFHQGDLLEPVATLRGHVDLVVSNPPYVDRRERDDARARGARPRAAARALPARASRYSIYRRLVPAAASGCGPAAVLVVEIAPALAEAVSRLLAEAGFGEARVASDLAGRPRMARGRRPLRTPAGLG